VRFCGFAPTSTNHPCFLFASFPRVPFFQVNSLFLFGPYRSSGVTWCLFPVNVFVRLPPPSPTLPFLSFLAVWVYLLFRLLAQAPSGSALLRSLPHSMDSPFGMFFGSVSPVGTSYSVPQRASVIVLCPAFRHTFAALRPNCMNVPSRHHLLWLGSSSRGLVCVIPPDSPISFPWIGAQSRLFCSPFYSFMSISCLRTL